MSKSRWIPFICTPSILLAVIVITSISCGMPDASNLQSDSKKADSIEIRAMEVAEDLRRDSLLIDSVLKAAVEIARQHINEKQFKDSFSQVFSTSTEVLLKTTISMGYLFTPKRRHLLIGSEFVSNKSIDIYTVDGKNIVKLLSLDKWGMEYTSDSIRDINGDGYGDLVVGWYATAGCCLKGFDDVYLYMWDKNNFTDRLTFINADFYPKEGVVRGVEYGHPGETPLYKYKWNGFAVDTIEYISPKDKNGLYIKEVPDPAHPGQFLKHKLRSVPNEYRKIAGYDWFTGNMD